MAETPVAVAPPFPPAGAGTEVGMLGEDPDVPTVEAPVVPDGDDDVEVLGAGVL